jgi:DNA-binding sugar fermentation-stimulating protein
MARTPPRRSTRLLNKKDQIVAPATQSSTSNKKRCVSTAADIPDKRSVITKSSAKSLQKTSDVNDKPLLLNLGTLVKGTVLNRPSTTIKSPYVADVSLPHSTTALAHAPALDCAGMCVSGKEVYLSCRPAGGKTSHAIELVESDALAKGGDAVLVGAHPRLGELIALEILKRGLLKDVLALNGGFQIGPVDDVIAGSPKKVAKSNIVDDMASNRQRISLKQQVTMGEMIIQNQKKSHRVIFEVKNVVCADYEKGTEPVKTGANHCVVVAEPREGAPYRRTALFPWAKSRSQTFEDKKVCSARALKHLKNLHDLAGDKDVTPVVLFIVNRSDCESVRACHEACPTFRDVLEEVTREGAVKALAVRVRWTEDGNCYFHGIVPVQT